MGTERDQKVIDAAIRRALAGGRPAAESCPDSNEVAAYLESRLPAARASRLEGHASACAACRELLALVVTLEAEGTAPALSARAVPASRRRLFRFAIPLPALAAVIAAVGVSVVLLRDGIRRPDAETARLADRLAPTPPIASPAPPRTNAAEPAPASAAKDTRAAAPVETSRAKVDQVASTPPPGRTETAGEREQRVAASADASESKAAAVAQVAEARPPQAAPASASQVQTASVELEQGRGPRQAPVRQLYLRQEQDAPRAAGFAGGVEQVRPLSPPEAVAALAARAPHALAAKSAVVGQAADAESARVSAPPAPQKASDYRKEATARERKVGGKTFVAFAGYWIDEECLRHPAAEIIELKKSSSEDEEIRKLLRSSGRADEASSDPQLTIIRHKDRTYLVR